MKEPVRILSDLHLGHRVSRIVSVENLRPLIAGVSTVLFNGDTWQELAKLFRQNSETMLGELRALCASEGAEPVFLSGNHDPGWPGAGWAQLAGGRILVTHGDALFAEGSPWSREALSKRDMIDEVLARHPAADRDPAARIALARDMAGLLRAASYPKGRKIWQRALDAVRPPRRAFEMLRVWATQPDAAEAFAERYFPTAEVIVIGHFHRAGLWHRNGRLVINTGSYMNPGPALWADYREGWLSCGRVDESQSAYQRGEVLGTWRVETGKCRVISDQ